MKQQLQKLPVHIGFIMDGNGRWAKERGLARSLGHRAGKGSLDIVIKECFYKYNIPYLSVYAFSTENWNRPQSEIDYLIKAFRNYLNKDLPKKYPGVRVNIMGDLSRFPEDIIIKSTALMHATQKNTKYTLNICLNYSGQQEITRAINKALQSGVKQVEIADVNNLLYSYEQPNLDFIVRTGGEQRLSNFMLWQAAYAELYFTKTLWPDFKKAQLLEALKEFQSRDRRFGAIESNH